MEKIINHCKDCWFFEAHKAKNGYGLSDTGFCHRYPPKSNISNRIGSHEKVMSNDWCGDFEQDHKED